MQESSVAEGRSDYPKTVLYVDGHDRRESCIEAIESLRPNIVVRTANSPEEAAERLADDTIDAVVVAHDTDVIDATAVLAVVDEHTQGIPVLLRTPAEALASLDGLLAAVTDYYLLDADHDGLVADRLAEVLAVDRQDWKAIINRMTDAFFAVDDEWRLTYVNEQATRILGAAMGRPDADSATLEGRAFWEEIPEAVGTTFYERYHEAMDRQEPVTFQSYYDPLETWFEVRAYPSETGLSVYFRNVTERRAQRERLATRDRALRKIYRTVADVGQTFTEQVESLLAIGCEVLGTSYGTLSRIDGETYVFDVVQSPDDTIEAGDTAPLDATNCERTVTTQQTVVLEDIAADAPELAERPGYTDLGIACYIGAPVFVDDEVYGTFCFYDDQPRQDPFSEWDRTLVDLLGQWISYELDRHRTHERLQAQNERLDQFASIVGHDLRNPLNVATSRLELAQRDHEGESEHLDAIERANDRMRSLIDDLLVLSREGVDPNDFESLSLESVVRTAWSHVETGESTLVVDTDRTVDADPSHLQRLLENLLRNSVQHGDAETVIVRDTPDGFEIVDDGTGIPEDAFDDVFEAGYSTARDGTGLGLAIVERLADNHGWTVTAGEGEDGGAGFTLSVE